MLKKLFIILIFVFVVTNAQNAFAICSGTETACVDLGDEASCTPQSGCSWAPGDCFESGGCCGQQVFDCGFLDGGKCENSGADTCGQFCHPVDGDCTSHGDQGSCEGANGGNSACSWNAGGPCGGTADACASFVTSGSCTAQAGCSWAGYDISGTVYTDDFVTNIGANKKVCASINGAAAYDCQLTNASGVYSFDDIPYTTGTVLTVYLEDEPEDAVYVKITAGGDYVGANMKVNSLIITDDVNHVITNAELAIGDDNADTDITNTYTVDGSNNITLGSDKELYVPAGGSHTYTPGGNVSVHDMSCRGTCDFGTNSVTVSGSWNAAGGTVITTGAVTFTSTSAETITTNGSGFWDLVINGSGGTFVMQDGIFAVSSLTLTDGTLDTKSGSNYQVTVGGNWTKTSGTFQPRSGTVVFVNSISSSHAITGSNSFNNLSFTESTNNSSDATFTFDAGSTQTIAGTLTLDGLDSNDMINLVSSDTVTRFTFSISGAQNVDYVDVSDSQVSGSASITAINSIDNNNTDTGEAAPHWVISGIGGRNALFFGVNF